jgi:hypothetical protein
MLGVDPQTTAETTMSRPTSAFRLLTLLAIAHASLAFYLWFCAFDLGLPSTSLHLWEILGALWLVWPAQLALRTAVLFARHVRATVAPHPAPKSRHAM